VVISERSPRHPRPTYPRNPAPIPKIALTKCGPLRMHEVGPQSVNGTLLRFRQQRLSMFLETTSSSNEEDVSGVRLQTPPGASLAAPDGPQAQATQRGELLTDVACVQTLIEAFGEEPDAFRIATVDIVRLLATGTAPHTLGESAAIVVSPLAVEAMEQLRALIPHVGIYVVARETAEVARTLPLMAAAGADEVFCLDTQADRSAFEETIRLRLAAPAPETEIRLLWKWFRESPERSLVMHCVRNGYRLDVWSIRSKVFSACRKTLQNRMTLLGLPSPGILSRCGRVLHAQELERRGVRPTTVIAAMLGFPSAGAMQRSRRRLRKALMSRGRQALVFASLLK